MKAWDWAITGPLRDVWVWTLGRPSRGRIQARTKSEARGLLKRQLGLAKVPDSVVFF